MERKITYDVCEGRPSWHQAKAGHISAARTTGFTNRVAAEMHVDAMRERYPNQTYFIIEVWA